MATINISAEELYEKIKENHPDTMLLDDMDAFTRGKLAGHVEIVLEMESILYPVSEEEENYEPERY